jgi:preprotein translocase subunit YajC
MFTLLQTASAGGSGSLLMSMALIAIIFLISYFLMIRPQNKKQKETEKMIAALKKGDKIVTIGGIHGVVSSTKEQTVIVKVDDNAKMEFSRSAIAQVILDPKEKSEKTEKLEKKSKSDKKTQSEDSIPAKEEKE